MSNSMMGASYGSTYTGERNSLGKPHGFGSFRWSDGRQYVGDFNEGESHGKGNWITPDGEKYDGQWQNGKFHGRGLFTFTDGKTYDGQFQNNKFHGYGKIKLPNGEIYQRGKWENGELVTRPPPTWKNYAIDINSVLIDLTNLVEQYYVFALTKTSDLDKTRELNFFFILIGVYTLTTFFRCMTFSERITTILGMLVEIGELIAYIFVFNGLLFEWKTLISSPNSFFIVVVFCLSFQLVLHSANFVLTNRSTPKKRTKTEYGIHFCTMLHQVGIVGSQTFFLFLNSESRFRQMYFEILLGFHIFIVATVLQSGSLPPFTNKIIKLSNNEEEIRDNLVSDKSPIGFWYNRILVIIYSIDNKVVSVSIIVISALELHQGNLVPYDLAWCIIWIIVHSIGIVSMISQFIVKRWKAAEKSKVEPQRELQNRY